MSFKVEIEFLIQILLTLQSNVALPTVMQGPF